VKTRHIQCEKTAKSPDKAFGKRLRQTREAAKKTQKEFAELAGVHVSVWAAYEKGKTHPRIDALVFLKEFDVSLDWLLTGKGPAPKVLTPEQELIETLNRLVAAQEQTIFFAHGKIGILEEDIQEIHTMLDEMDELDKQAELKKSG